MKHARTGSAPNCPASAQISVCGRAHAGYAFPVQTVHLVVDSGELGQPDVTFGLEGMARRPAYNESPCWQDNPFMEILVLDIYFCKSARDSTSPPQPRGLVSGM